MPLAVTDDQRVVGDAVRAAAKRWAGTDVVRAQEHSSDAWREIWRPFADLGVLACALPAEQGGGGTVTDLAVGLEQAAAALVPGPVLSTALAALLLADAGAHAQAAQLGHGERTGGISVEAPPVQVERSATGAPVLHGSVRPVLGGGLLLVRAADEWFVVDDESEGVKTVDLPAADFSGPLTEVQLDAAPATELPGLTTQRVRDLAATLAAAEAAGIAARCLQIASDYAKVREQFGRPIGSFQAVKHLCAEMLCRSEIAAATAWDAAESAGDGEQHTIAAAVAAATALDAAVDNAKDCIQVLGGIGFTWEHEAHLYLRRAVAQRQFVGGSAGWRRRVAALTVAGQRRALRVDLSDAAVDRAAVREAVATIASAPDQRRALADTGYLTPHWPAPYGLGAAPALQLVIDEELAAANVQRPDLVIAGWAIPTILRHGTPAQIERFVQPTLYGQITWCQLFSEPGAGSDLASLRTRAERVAGGWQLTGQKVWTSLADRADWGICLARTDSDAPKHKGISYFLVDMRSAGIDIRPLREITGDPAFNEVFLDAVFVPDELLVGEVNGGWPLARTTLSHERVAMGGGSSIGDAVERLVADAVSRTPGAASSDEGLGALVAAGLAGSLLDLRSTLRRLGGVDDGAAAGVRKLIGVRHRQDVAEAALERLGADGMVAGEQLEEFLLTRCLTIAGGTTQVLLSMAAERILGLPRG